MADNPQVTNVGDELKPCPFCGSHEIVVDEDLQTYIFCDACGASVPGADSKADAISAWNRRTNEDRRDG